MNDHRVYVIGIDLGKNWFHLVANDERGTELFRKKLNRGQLAEFAVTAQRLGAHALHQRAHATATHFMAFPAQQAR